MHKLSYLFPVSSSCLQPLFHYLDCSLHLICQLNDDVTGFNQGFPGARPLQAVMQNLISLPKPTAFATFSWQPWGTMPFCFSSPTTARASTSLRNCLRTKFRMPSAGSKRGHRHSSKFAFAHEPRPGSTKARVLVLSIYSYVQYICPWLCIAKLLPHISH